MESHAQADTIQFRSVGLKFDCNAVIFLRHKIIKVNFDRRNIAFLCEFDEYLKLKKIILVIVDPFALRPLNFHVIELC